MGVFVEGEKHPQLSSQTSVLLLLRKKKNSFFGLCHSIADEQFVLSRVADCAIDLYAMVVVLSRYAQQKP